MTLQCGSWQGFDWFYLSDKGRGGHHHMYSQRRDDGWSQALLTVGPVRPTHWWAYRCYGVFSGSPHVWSSPSGLVELLISGEKVSALPRNPLGLWAGGEKSGPRGSTVLDEVGVRTLRDQENQGRGE